MATAAKTITCPSCGYRNTPPIANRRCVSCGARIESLRARGAQRGGSRRYKRRGFSPAWFVLSLGIIAVTTALLVVGLPLAVPLLDFEGSAGMLVALSAWFLGGLLVGLVSPGKTLVEPVLSTLLVAAPTALWLFTHQTVKTMPGYLYVMLSVLGALFTLIGTHTGERIQLGPPPKPSE